MGGWNREVSRSKASRRSRDSRRRAISKRFSINAASIGQVHLATKEGKELAVKIQYPGVAGSIASDLALVKPIAMKMFNIKGKNSDQYFKEIENKLMEETL